MMLESNGITLGELWESAIRILKNDLHSETFNHWIKPVVPIAIKDNSVTLGVSDDFFADWLKDTYGDAIKEALKKSAGRELTIKYEFGHHPVENHDVAETAVAAEPAAGLVTPVDEVLKPKKRMTANEERNFNECSGNLLNRYTFDKFVVGEENRYAYAAATTAAKSPGVYNPLYIWGGTGMGKTHLIQAVAHEVLRKKPKAKVQYVTCEEFLNRYVDSLGAKKHSDFRNWVRNVDMLLVDDVHQLANKTQLQEEFFNTFNALHNVNKQIILTSDKAPSEIKGLEGRLVSRFEQGVTIEMTTPSFETRLAILKMKQDEHLIKLEDDVLQFIAERISASIRRLEGALLRLVAFSSVEGNHRITIDRAEDLLRNLLEEENISKKVSIENIQKAVAEYFEIRVSDILSTKRPKNIAEPRMIAMFLSRRLTERSYPEIGEAFGKNHATIMHAEKTVVNRCDKDESFRMSVSAIQRQLQS